MIQTIIGIINPGTEQWLLDGPLLTAESGSLPCSAQSPIIVFKTESVDTYVKAGVVSFNSVSSLLHKSLSGFD